MTPMTRPLPWDFFRCQPTQVDAKCENCKRWIDHPDQELGPRTAYAQATDSKSPSCSHAPISFME